jgi:hemerythrin-like metal-binding protein
MLGIQAYFLTPKTLTGQACEEALISRLNYPKLEEHKAEHQQFRNKIKEILAYQSKEQFIIEDMLMEFLENWLTTHILIEDMKALSFNS